MNKWFVRLSAVGAMALSAAACNGPDIGASVGSAGVIVNAPSSKNFVVGAATSKDTWFTATVYDSFKFFNVIPDSVIWAGGPGVVGFSHVAWSGADTLSALTYPKEWFRTGAVHVDSIIYFGRTFVASMLLKDATITDTTWIWSKPSSLALVGPMDSVNAAGHFFNNRDTMTVSGTAPFKKTYTMTVYGRSSADSTLVFRKGMTVNSLTFVAIDTMITVTPAGVISVKSTVTPIATGVFNKYRVFFGPDTITTGAIFAPVTDSILIRP